VASTGAAAIVTTSRRLLITALSAFATAVIARKYGAEEFGGYASALAAYGLVLAASDLGFTILLGRELSRDVAGRGRLMRATAQVQLAWCIGLAVVFDALAFLRDDPLQRDVMLIFGPAVILGGLTAYRTIFNVVFRIREIATVDIIVNVTAVAATLALAFTGTSLRVIAAAVATGYAVNTLLAVYLARRHIDDARPSGADRRWVIRTATPLGLASLLASMYFVLDMALVGYLVEGEQLGFYAAAVKLLSLLVAVPGMVMAVSLPGLSMARDDRDELGRFARRTSHWIAATGLPACAACAVFAHPLVEFIYGSAYGPADQLVRILSLAAVIALVSNVLGTLQITLGIVRAQLIANSIALTVNIVGNVVLVPKYGVESSAWLTVGCELIVVGSALVVLASRVDLVSVALGAARPALAVAIASACGLVLLGTPAIAIPVAAAVFVAAVVLLDAWPHELRPSSIRQQSI
jgi:O-antigen/teichoic acid export membrane protein